MDFQPHIDRFQKRYEELEGLIAAPDFYNNPDEAQKVLKEHSRLKQALEIGAKINLLEKTIQENKQIIEDAEDEELVELAEEELPDAEKDLGIVKTKMLGLILPPEENDSRNIIIEIRAGTGGDEAALFAGDLYRMYTRLSEKCGWKMDILDSSPSDSGGYKEIIFGMNGDDVYSRLQFESGVHRVQRVPATESQGRIHTSAATVAVLPEAKEVDMEIKPEELKISVCRSSGPGGQGVNTTDSAVEIQHLPTGLIVRCQDGRSQIKNKEKAMNILRSRLLEQRQREEKEKYAAHRRAQVGSGDRNEKIRTYNYPQNRITDHRINCTLYNLTGFMDGDLGEMLDQLEAYHLNARLEAFQEAGGN